MIPDITFLCCINKGHVTMTASADRNAITPGEICELKVFVNNTRSQVSMKELRFHIIRIIHYQKDDHVWMDLEKIATIHRPELPKGTTTERSASLHLPNSAMPSINGSMIKCKYHLVVELAVPWSLNTGITLPLQVYAPAKVEDERKLQYPPNWTAVTMPNVFLKTK